MLLKSFSLYFFVLVYEMAYSDEYSAPIQFIEEPKYIQFSNKNSGYLYCAAKATSSYSNTDYVSWRYSNGSPVTNISKTILVLPNGTLWFPPFKKLIPQVHRGKFQCVAKLRLQHRAILSKIASVNGVILQSFQVTVEDQYVIGIGGTAMFTCNYPENVSSYVQLKRWWIDKTIAVPEPSGHLVINDVETKHSSSLYYCVVLNLLTKEIIASNVAKLFIRTAPTGTKAPLEFRIQPVNKTVFVGEAILLECLVVRKNVEYIWKHNDSLIKLSHRIYLARGRSLRVAKAALEDRGNYTCIVKDKNTNEMKSATATLIVQEPLTFHQRPRKICTSFKSNVTFHCEINGYPPPNVTWYKDAELIKYDSKYIREGNNLVITTAWGRDEGIYQCLATNDIETIHQAASLIVGAYPPKITKSFAAKVLDEHTKLVISCSAIGDHKPTLSWYLDGKLINNVGGRIVVENHQDLWTLQIKNVTAVDSGVYRCEAKNRAGVNFSEADILVKGPAKITHISQNSVGFSGKSVNISCEAKGYPAPNLTWWFKNDELPNDYRHSVIFTGNRSILIIEQLRSSDQGKYICHARNEVGPADKAISDLSVLSVPEKGDLQVKKEGDVATLTCHQGKIWAKDGKGIRTRGRFVVHVVSNLIILEIRNVSVKDSGKYYCSETLRGDIYKKSDEIFVITKPRFTNKHKKVYDVLELHDIQMQCPASGFPTPRVDWQRKIGARFQPIPKSSRFITTLNGSLTIINATTEDATDYTCIADNINKAYRKSQLKVHVPAKIVKWLSSALQDAGNSVTLYCYASGNPKMTFTWLKDHKVISSDKRIVINNQISSSILAIKRAIGDDTGTYTCIAKNDYGTDKRNMTLIIRDKPDPPKVTYTIPSKRTIEVFWKVENDGNSPITSYEISFEKSGQRSTRRVMQAPANKTSYLISGLIPNTNYVIYVSARNVKGLSDSSGKIEVTTNEDVPAVAPSSIKITPRDKGFLIEWQKILQRTKSGEIKGYYIRYREFGAKSDFKVKKTTKGDGRRAVLSGLKDYTQYEIILRAYTNAGPGPNSDIHVERTNEGVPSQPPLNINATLINSTSVFISWDKPPGDTINGVIVGYNIICENTVNVCDGFPKNVDLQTNITLHGLLPYTRYVIKLSARTKRGVGVSSTPMKFFTSTPDEELDKEVETKFSSKIFYKDTTVLGTLIGVCLFIIIVIVVLVLLTKLGFKPGSKILQRSIETWRWFVAKRSSSEDRRRHRRSGGSSTDGHLGGSSSSLSQQASNTGSLFSLPMSSSRVTESGYITNFMPIPAPFNNYNPGSNGCGSLSGSSDEGIGPETRVGAQHGRGGESSDAHSQSYLPPRSSNGTPAPLTLATSPRQYDEVWLADEYTNLPKRTVSANNKRNVSDKNQKSSSEEEKGDEDAVHGVPMGKERVYMQSLDQYADCLPFNISTQRPKYEDGHFIIGPDIDRILAYRPPRCYDSTSSEYSSSRDELAQAYEFGKLHHLDDFYGRPTLESASSSGETASSEKDGICHFSKELSVGRPFLIPVALLPPPPNQRLRSRDRNRNTQGAPLKTYYEKDETLV